MLDAFYDAFAPACFGLLGLWLVVVQIRMPDWQDRAAYRQRSYGVALHFALPGIMSLVALIDPQDPAFWRVSFAVVAIGGAVVLATVSARPSRARGTGQAGRLAAEGQLGRIAFIAATALYVLIGVLAFAGGRALLRVEALLLIALLFVGFNAAWLLLFDDASRAHSRAPTREPQAAPGGTEPGMQPY